MAITLKPKSGNVDLTTRIQAVKGDDGGYYIPAVDAEGNLTWTASETGMEAVASANIKGIPGEPGKDGKDGQPGRDGKDGAPGRDGIDGKDGINGTDGKDGESGVYVGTTEPTDDSVIWINPEGGANESLATKAYVDEAISNIEAPTPDLTGYATESYVNDAITEALNGIANAEDGAY